MSNLVASDLEGTLTTGSTWRILGEFLKSHGLKREFQGFYYPRIPLALLARVQLINAQRFREQWFVDITKLIRGFDRAHVDELIGYIVEELWRERRKDVVEALERHRAEGCRVVMLSGTYQQAAEQFAARFGAEGFGTPLEFDGDGRATGRLAERLNTGAQKVQRLRDELGANTLLAAYGDTEGDVPMLALARMPIAVYPDAKLASIAKARGWRTLSSTITPS